MRRIIAVVVATFTIATILAGCGGGNQPKPPAGPVSLVLVTGGPGGTYHPYGTAMAALLSGKLANIRVAAQATGASIENLRLVNKKEAELGIVQNDTMDYAYYGKEMFKEKLTNLRGVAILYPEIIQVVVRADSKITSIADLKGRPFGAGPPGSGSEANLRQLLDVYGMESRMLAPAYLSFAQSAEQFKEKLIDGFIVTAGIPNPAISDIGGTTPLRILELPEDKIAKLSEKYPFITPYTIQASAYKGLAAPVKTVAVQATLVTNAEISPDVIYQIVKALFENQAELGQSHPKGNELALASALKGISIPLHPGAERYYREKGLIK